MELEQYEKSHSDMIKAQRAYEILREGAEATRDEITDLISHFEKSENFEICEKLKKLL